MGGRVSTNKNVRKKLHNGILEKALDIKIIWVWRLLDMKKLKKKIEKYTPNLTTRREKKYGFWEEYR